MKCEQCGKEMQPHASKCIYCGWSMIEQKEQKKKSKLPIIIFIIAVIAIGMFATFKISTRRNPNISKEMYNYAKDALEYSDKFCDGKISSIEASTEIGKICELCEPNSNYSKDEFVESDIENVCYSIINESKENVKVKTDELRKDLH